MRVLNGGLFYQHDRSPRDYPKDEREPSISDAPFRSLCQQAIASHFTTPTQFAGQIGQIVLQHQVGGLTASYQNPRRCASLVSTQLSHPAATVLKLQDSF